MHVNYAKTIFFLFPTIHILFLIRLMHFFLSLRKVFALLWKNSKLGNNSKNFSDKKLLNILFPSSVNYCPKFLKQHQQQPFSSVLYATF